MSMIFPIDVEKRKIEEKISFKNFSAEKLSPLCVDEDFTAVIENRELIKRTRGNAGDWPNPETLTLEENFIDLAWHQREFEYGLSFAFVLRNLEGVYMGCVYLYPMGFRSSPSDTETYDLDFSFWLTQEFYDKGYYTIVRDEFFEYLKSLSFEKVYYSNVER